MAKNNKIGIGDLIIYGIFAWIFTHSLVIGFKENILQHPVLTWIMIIMFVIGVLDFLTPSFLDIFPDDTLKGIFQAPSIWIITPLLYIAFTRVFPFEATIALYIAIIGAVVLSITTLGKAIYKISRGK